MHSAESPLLRVLFLTLAPLALLMVAGCGGGGAGTLGGTDTTTESLTLAADPLDGVLNSTQGHTPPDPEERILGLAEELGLTEEQTQEMQRAHEEFHNGLEALHAQVQAGELTRERAQEEAHGLRDALEADMQVILTDEQYDQLQQMRQEREGHRHGHRNREDRWNAWMEEIGADETQRAAIEAAQEELRTDMHALHEDVRDGTLTHEEAAEVAETLRADFDAELQAILTADQYAALQELRPDRCDGPPEGAPHAEGPGAGGPPEGAPHAGGPPPEHP